MIDVILKCGTEIKQKFPKAIWPKENIVELSHLPSLHPNSFMESNERLWHYFLWCPHSSLHSLQMYLCLNINLLIDNKWGEQYEYNVGEEVQRQCMGDRCLMELAVALRRQVMNIQILFCLFNLNLMYKTRNMWLAQEPAILMPKLLPGLNQISISWER